MSKIIALGERLKVVRTPVDIRRERINALLARLDSLNCENNLAGFSFVAITEDGKPLWGHEGPATLLEDLKKML